LVADDDPLGEALVAVLPLLDEQALVSDKGLRRGRRFLLGVRGAFSSSVSYGAGRTRSSGRGPAPLTVPRERDRVGGKQCQRAAQAEEQWKRANCRRDADGIDVRLAVNRHDRRVPQT
jgi:hypothetical protein